MIFPDEYSKEVFGPETRNMDDIFLVSRKVVPQIKNFLEANADYYREIANNFEMKTACLKLRSGNIYRILEPVKKAVQRIHLKPSIPPSQLAIDVTIACNPSKFSYNGDSCESIICIQEDEIEKELFAQFFEAYTRIPPYHQPLFLIFSKNSFDSLKNRLEQCPENYSIKELGIHGILNKYALSNKGCGNTDTYISQYTEQAFSAVANTEQRIFDPSDSHDLSIGQIFSNKLYFIRSMAIIKSKFETIPYALSFKNELEILQEEHLQNENAFTILLFKALINLWLIYCRERSREIYDNAMAIAVALGNDLVQAHALRFISLIEKPGPFSEYCLKKATSIFNNYECYDHANYCVNNLLFDYFYRDNPFSYEYIQLIENSSKHIQNLFGLSIIYNNAGVSLLVEGNYPEAAKYCDEAINNPGMALHMCGIRTNKIIARYLGGEHIQDSEIYELAEETINKIDHRYEYQMANILFNLLKAAKQYGDAWDHILEIIKNKDYLNNVTITKSHSTLMYQLSTMGLVSGIYELDRGIRGVFIEKTGFVPIIHKTWI